MRKLLAYVGFIAVALGLTSCRNASESPATNSVDSVNTQIVTSDDNVDSLGHNDYSDCVRGQAEPILKKEIFPTAVFTLDDNRHSGTEEVTFASGDRVVIRNEGCEYVVIAFRFETARFQHDTTDVKYWLEKALLLTGELGHGLDDPLNIAQTVLPALDSLRNHTGIVLGEELVMDDSEIRKFITLDRVQLLDKSRYGVEVSYLLGPL